MGLQPENRPKYVAKTKRGTAVAPPTDERVGTKRTTRLRRSDHESFWRPFRGRGDGRELLNPDAPESEQ